MKKFSDKFSMYCYIIASLLFASSVIYGNGDSTFICLGSACICAGSWNSLAKNEIALKDSKEKEKKTRE